MMAPSVNTVPQSLLLVIHTQHVAIMLLQSVVDIDTLGIIMVCLSLRPGSSR